MVWPIVIRRGFFTYPGPEARIKRWYFHFNSGTADHLSADASTLKQSLCLSGSPGETSNFQVQAVDIGNGFLAPPEPRTQKIRLPDGAYSPGGLFTLKMEFILAPLKIFLEVCRDGIGTPVGTQDIEPFAKPSERRNFSELR